MYSDELSRHIEIAKDAIDGYRLLFAIVLTPLLLALSSIHSFYQDGSDLARWSLSVGIGALSAALCGLVLEMRGEMSHHTALKRVGSGKSEKEQAEILNLLASKSGGVAFTFWSFVIGGPLGYATLGLAYLSLLWGWGK